MEIVIICFVQLFCERCPGDSLYNAMSMNMRKKIPIAMKKTTKRKTLEES